MPTITGTYRRGGGTPERGWLLFTPTAAITDGEEVILPSAERVPLEVDGTFEVDLEATDDTSWIPTGWVWQIDERLPGGRTWNFELTADTDIGDLIPVEVPDSFLPWVFTADATTTAPGTDADVVVTHVGNAVGFTFEIPRGDKGETGDEGPPNVLSIGTVTTEAPGDPATAEITGTSPAQVLNLGIPEGDKGDKGDQGDPGPTTDLSVGTVTTGAPGSSAAATITGTPPTLELDLTIPRGDVGATGPANALAIGTVTTGAPGSSAAATITGTPPSQTLDLTIPRGDVGATGMPSSLYDAKGDIIAATANDTPARVAVGANGTLLVADSTASTGVAWRAPSPITASAIGVTLDRANPVYTFTSGSVTATLPTAATHTGVRFLIRNAGSGTVTVSGITGLTIPGAGYVDVVSDGSAWMVLEGAYATSAVGLASYRWNQASSNWRLIAYDSGWRTITAITSGGVVTGDALTASWQPLSGVAGLVRARRVMHTTYFIARFVQVTTTTPTTGLWVPTSGFESQVNSYQPIATNSTPIYHATTAGITYGTVAAGSYVQGMAVWDTFPTLPTSLPGTQATAPV